MISALLVAALIALQGAGPRFPFEPLRLEATVRINSGQLDCRATFQGQEIARDCSMVEGTGAPAALRELDANASMTMVVAIDPAGGAPLPDDLRDRGDLIIESDAVYGITPGGDVTDCRSTVRRVVRSMPGIQSVPDMCAAPFFADDAFVVARAVTTRRGQIRMRIYLRVTSPARVG